MAPRSRLSIAKVDILNALNALKKQGKIAFARSELDELLSNQREFWQLAKKTTVNQFIKFLEGSAGLQLHTFKFPRPTCRYSLGPATTLELVQSLSPNGYFSHYTAMSLHGLTEQIPKTIYFNTEQRLRPGGGELTQAGINRAFAMKCRVTNNVSTFREQTICMLNGGNTDDLGVVPHTTAEGAKIRVTNIERTLIDIVVRPIYSGGISEVAKAYSNASGLVSVNKLAAYLRDIGYTYPYHQAVGYYLDRSRKYTDSQLSLIQQFEMKFDFMLDYQMKDKEFVEKWRLFVPKGF